MIKKLLLLVCITFAFNCTRADAETPAAAVPVANAAPGSIWDINATEIDGQKISLSTFKGQVLLIVNTASKCGFTPQYHDLEALYTKYHSQGFSVLGFPSNDFDNQEPGTDAEIKKFCALRYGVTFPLFKRAPVSGPSKQPTFSFLTSAAGSTMSGEVQWNFEKFLVARDGTVRNRFGSFINPGSTRVKDVIETLLAEPMPTAVPALPKAGKATR